MQTSKQRELGDPKNWPYAYTYDLQGFFTGMVRMQLDQLETEQQGFDIYLLPASSTKEKPPMKEGFQPRWDGERWELIEKGAALEKRSVMDQVVDEVREKLFRDSVKNVEDLAKSKMQAETNKMQTLFSKQMIQFEKEVRLSSQAIVMQEIEKLWGPLNKVISESLEEMRRLSNEATQIHSQTVLYIQQEKTQMQEFEISAEESAKLSANAAAESRSWWQKILGIKGTEVPKPSDS